MRGHLRGSLAPLRTELPARGARQGAANIGSITEPAPAAKRRRLAGMAAMAGARPEHLEQRLSVAPMMDWTDVHYRQLARLISRHTWLYTEMVVDQTVLHAEPKDKWLWFPPEQRPIVCQLGGSNPDTLAQAAAIVAGYGYDEINLNCGCPSDRVAGAGCFGASLMLQPEAVAACCAAMRAAAPVPVTVKCRIGVDNVDSYEALCRFVATVAERGGVAHFVIHARKCILKGLSPAQNRTVPPLRRGWVWALQRDFPQLAFSLNGVVSGCAEAAALNAHGQEGAALHGCMIGRAAYERPWQCLADADRAVFGAAENAATSRRQVLREYAAYGDAVLGRWGTKRDGTRVPGVKAIVKPLLGIFHGERGTKRWKQELDRILKHAPPELTVSQVLEEALRAVPPEVLDAPPAALPPPEVAATLRDVPAAVAGHLNAAEQTRTDAGAGAADGQSTPEDEAAVPAAAPSASGPTGARPLAAGDAGTSHAAAAPPLDRELAVGRPVALADA